MVGELPSPEGLPGRRSARATRSPSPGPFAPALAGSELAKLRGELGPGLGAFEIGAVKAAIAEVREAVRAGWLHTAHDVSDGGLACALAESAIEGGVGLQVDLGAAARRDRPRGMAVRGGPGRVRPRRRGHRVERLVEAGTATLIGIAAGQDIRIAAGPLSVDVPVADAAAAWSSLGQLMEAAPA